MITTTLNEIRYNKVQKPCAEGWEKFLKFLNKTKPDDEPLSLLTILESNGFDDALWALRCLDTKYDSAIRLFACYCARSVLDIYEKEYPNDNRPRKAIEAAEQFAYAMVDQHELVAAWDAARAAARDAAWAASQTTARAAARDAAWAATAPAAASQTAAWDAARDAARTAARAAAWATAWAATEENIKPEFIRMCKLDGEYGVVTELAERRIKE